MKIVFPALITDSFKWAKNACFALRIEFQQVHKILSIRFQQVHIWELGFNKFAKYFLFVFNKFTFEDWVSTNSQNTFYSSSTSSHLRIGFQQVHREFHKIVLTTNWWRVLYAVIHISECKFATPNSTGTWFQSVSVSSGWLINKLLNVRTLPHPFLLLCLY